jgi:hypothetical protein
MLYDALEQSVPVEVETITDSCDVKNVQLPEKYMLRRFERRKLAKSLR